MLNPDQFKFQLAKMLILHSGEGQCYHNILLVEPDLNYCVFNKPHYFRWTNRQGLLGVKTFLVWFVIVFIITRINLDQFGLF